MGAGNVSDQPLQPLQQKAAAAVIEELQRQAAENPEALRITMRDSSLNVEGDIDVDALVMVVIGAMAGGP